MDLEWGTFGACQQAGLQTGTVPLAHCCSLAPPSAGRHRRRQMAPAVTPRCVPTRLCSVLLVWVCTNGGPAVPGLPCRSSAAATHSPCPMWQHPCGPPATRQHGCARAIAAAPQAIRACAPAYPTCRHNPVRAHPRTVRRWPVRTPMACWPAARAARAAMLAPG